MNMLLGPLRQFSLFTFSGSKSLTFVSETTGLPLDQVNFVSCQILALFLSIVLKAWIKTAHVRLWYCLIVGVSICIFCYGNQTLHMATLGAITHFVTRRWNRARLMPWFVLGVSIFYLSFLHLRRQFFEPGFYNLDITAPMMVLVQKVSSLAFSVHDGQFKENREDGDNRNCRRTDLQNYLAIGCTPTPLRYWSYVFHFQSMLAGPLVMYNDYTDFIDTDSVPSSGSIVFQKLVGSVVFAVVILKIAPNFNFSTLRDDKFLNNTNLLYKLFFLDCLSTIARCKYYHAWMLADAVCNASGLGYNRKTNTFDLTTNVHPVAFELSTSFKGGMDAWNIGTGKWFRYVMYERAPANIRTVVTYTLSAVWHGFYPGYYLTFLTGALFTSAARPVRRHVRPHFVSSVKWKRFYDLCTFVMTRFCCAYFAFSFGLFDFVPSFTLYKKMCFSLHILAVMAMVLVPKATPAAAATANLQSLKSSNDNARSQ